MIVIALGCALSSPGAQAVVGGQPYDIRQAPWTLFVDIVAWEKLAETCNTYLKKGMSCLVEGRLSIRQYDDKEGNKRQATEVVINTMQMLGSRQDRPQQESGEGFGNGTPVAAGAARVEDSLDEEIPF